MSAPSPDRIHRYRILSEIGRGAMGRVYLAEDPNVGRRVALKVLRPRRLADPAQQAGLRRRFLHEIRAAGRLHHPGIVAVFDAGTDRATGSPFLAMEWVAGGTLRRLLERAGPLSPLAAASLAAQVARALEHAHRRGVVHRDVKPTNLLITDDRRGKLADFGIARLVRSRTVTAPGVVFGTPCYMAPEQIRGASVDGRCDLFALGAVLYECVTGRRAFGADSPEAVRHRVLADAPAAYPSGVPPSLGRVIDRALEKRPEARFQTGAEFAAALDGVAAELSADASGPSRPASPIALGAPGADRGGTEEETVRLTAGTEVTGAGLAEIGVRTRRRREAIAVLGLTVLLAILIRDLEPARDPAPRPRRLPAVAADRGPVLTYPPTAPPLPAGPAPRRAAAPEVRPPTPTADAATPATVAAGRASGSTTSPPTPAATPSDPPPAAAATSTLEIVHRNRLRRALLSVWIDGERVWVERLNGNLLARLVGRRLRRQVEVPPGEHAVEVRISDLSRRLEAGRSIAGRFTAGEEKRLRVQLRRDRDELDLRWRETREPPRAAAAWAQHLEDEPSDADPSAQFEPGRTGVPSSQTADPSSAAIVNTVSPMTEFRTSSSIW